MRAREKGCTEEDYLTREVQEPTLSFFHERNSVGEDFGLIRACDRNIMLISMCLPTWVPKRT